LEIVFHVSLERSDWNHAETALISNNQAKLVARQQKDISLFPVTRHQRKILYVLIALIYLKIVIITNNKLKEYFGLNLLI